jgi:hypothetical protein
VRDQEWDAALAELYPLDLAQLVGSLLLLDAVDSVSALGIVDEAEVLASLLEGNDVHEAGGVGDIGADLAVNLDEALHKDGPCLAEVQGILEAVADEDNEGKALSLLVRTGGGLGGVGTRKLVEKPVGRGAQALLVLLTTRQKLCQHILNFEGIPLRLRICCVCAFRQSVKQSWQCRIHESSRFKYF